mmetsp:Transcript_15194/g.22752  ORF Transcript_15194/g.22752 Transcript_15194/m.22752 type:complete len:201 (-) Transcript_15194:8-610(-)
MMERIHFHSLLHSYHHYRYRYHYHYHLLAPSLNPLRTDLDPYSRHDSILSFWLDDELDLPFSHFELISKNSPLIRHHCHFHCSRMTLGPQNRHRRKWEQNLPAPSGTWGVQKKSYPNSQSCVDVEMHCHWVCLCSMILYSVHPRAAMCMSILLMIHPHSHPHSHSRLRLYCYCYSHALFEAWLSVRFAVRTAMICQGSFW